LKRLVQRPRWKILTSSYRRCDISEGLDLTEGSVLVGQLLALQGGSAIGWMTKEISINFWQKKVFCHLQGIQTKSEATPAASSFHAQGKMSGP